MDDKRRIEIGKTIKTARLQNGMSLQRFAETLGTTGGTVSTWERGMASPVGYRTALLFKKYGVEIPEWNECLKCEKTQEFPPRTKHGGWLCCYNCDYFLRQVFGNRTL